MCKTDYQFRVDLAASIINVYPIYEEKILDATRQGKNKYLKTSINAKFYFIGDDFTAFMGEDIEHEFKIRIDKIVDGVTQLNWKTGTFTRLDFEVWNAKIEERIEVSIELDDLYTRIEEKQDKEMNFFDLNVGARTVKYDILPLFQIYNSFNGKISNHLRGNYWEEFAAVPTKDPAILAGFGFQNVNIGGAVTRFGMGFGEPNLNGKYLVDGGSFQNENTLYRVDFTIDGSGEFYDGELIRESDNFVLFEYKGEGLGLSFDNAKFVHVDGEAAGLFTFQGTNLYSRVLVAVDTVAGQTVIALTEDDISTNKGNYTHIIEGSFVGVEISTTSQVAKTPYLISGIPTGTNENRYFTELANPPFYQPVLKSSWLGGAVFMFIGATGLGFFNTAVKEVKNDYCFELVDVVRAMMGNMVDDVTIGATLGEFFGVTNPISLTSSKRMFITHKSNVKDVNFENPATKATIKFSEIKNLMEFGFNCFPYLEGNELRFEHSLFFENGKSYTTENIGYDLTTLLESKNDKLWSFGTNQWKYAKEEIPGAIVTKWSDSGSIVFDGYRIKLLSKYANKTEPNEEIISNFMTDMDYIMSNPDSVGSQGFVLMFVDTLEDGTFKVNYQSVGINGNINDVQNGKGAMVYLHDKFHRNGLPCRKVEINEEAVDALSVKRTRVQEITFGGGEGIDNLKLVKTELGNGEVEKWGENLEDGSIIATLRHNIE
ncbi:MAG: hypothetical protein Unbinned5350contig1001_1 [Prokaryotic dsDNA virus sp.]|nr:MAG: hypothetical protein Unbinned5350contig1001_1 [Prokaryotic dsDNA virus sp.]|tara:strand:- start:36634 stop:38772 length:2139 start_codon:yes stop_codon:yes gene_type:complete